MHRITLLALSLGLLLTQCNDRPKPPATTPANNSSNSKLTSTEEPTAADTRILPGGSNDIIGTWKLQLDAFDDNNNGLLDPEERAKATPNNTSYQFNADGSCVIQGMFKGSYELKKDNLTVRRERMPEEEDDPVPEHFRVLSVSADELVLLMQESSNENTIWIFKRQ